MLNFFRSDGTLKERSLYKYLQKNKNDPESQAILNTPGHSRKEKYLNYFKGKVTTTESAPTFSNIQEDFKDFDFENNTSTSSVILPTDKPLTEDELLKAHGYNPADWKIIKHQCSKWQSGTQILMSSKIFVRLRYPLEGSPATLMQKMNKALNIPKIDFNTKITKDNEKLLVIPISDLHYGLLSDEITSDSVYNMEIAEQRLKEYVNTTLENVNIPSITKILITFGNDYFNCDNVQGTTNRGTPQDNESSYFTIWDKGVNLGISIIDYLLEKTKAEIDVIGVQGNHDLQSSHAMSAALYFNYKNNKRVLVDASSDEKARYYYRFGENLIGFGHETKIKECHRIVSSECKDWSNFKYRTMFLGHLHKEEVLDTGALVVRRLPILSGKSTWTDQQGFMEHPRAQSFVFGAKKGLLNIINVEMC